MEHRATSIGGIVLDPRIVVALDFASGGEALELAEQLDASLCRVKVGLELFSVAGPSVVTSLRERGFDVFLDLKFHDIPTTVARACTAAARLGVWMLNVHTLGGAKMMQAARSAVDDSGYRPLLIGVTLLTSHDDTEIAVLGLRDGTTTQVERLASLAQDCRLDGVVCSAREAAGLRRRFGPQFTIVTPGIRAEGENIQDQARTLTPLAAITQGSDYLVIGRPITRAANPGEALARIAQSLNSATQGVPGRQGRDASR